MTQEPTPPPTTALACNGSNNPSSHVPATNEGYLKQCDPRRCALGEDRYGEFGVIGAEQADESHFDTRDYYCEEDQEQDDDQDDEEEEDEAHRLPSHARIRFSTRKLYGRQDELQRLQELYHSMTQRQRQRQRQQQSQEEDKNDNGDNSAAATVNAPPTKTVFLSGFSGCGKSTLVNQFVEQIHAMYDNHEPSQQQTQQQPSMDPLFLKAKYEQQQQHQSHNSTAPFAAFSGLFDQIPLYWRAEFEHVYASLRESLGEDVSVLRRIFPQLRYLFLGRKSSTRSSDPDDSCSVASSAHSLSALNSAAFSLASSRQTHQNLASPPENYRSVSIVVNKSRLKFAISALFRALCSHLQHRPLVLFVDDLQWADESGLELLQHLITDDALPSLFFIGAYRCNEVDENHRLTNMINALEHKHQVPIQQMYLAEMNAPATAEFIADSLRLDMQDVAPLTEAIFAQTLGNPLYTKQALEHLVRKNVLYYDTVVFAWSWNLGEPSAGGKTCINYGHGKLTYLEDLLACDIVGMVKSKIEYMPNKELQHALAVASYIRATFDTDTLLDVMTSINIDNSKRRPSSPPQPRRLLDSSSLTDSKQLTGDDGSSGFEQKCKLLHLLLEEAVEEGLLVHSSSVDSNPNNHTYSFVHDRIQEAAMLFLGNNDEEAKSMLWKIGSALHARAHSPECGEDWMFFAAARLLNSIPRTGNAQFDQNARIKLAKLNLHTAELSMYLLAFANTVEYAKCGIENLSNLEDDMWAMDFDLAFALHSIGAQAQVGAGNLEEAEKYCAEVLQRKRSTKEALPTYKAYLDVLAGRGSHEEAIMLNISILRDLGVKFPAKPYAQKIKSWLTMQRIKAGQIPTEEKIKAMPFVTDPVAADTMDLIQKAVRFAFYKYPELYNMLCCESIRCMNKYGLTDSSGAAMASFANIVTHKFGDFKTGTKLAELAITIVDRQKNKFNETHALNTANQNVLGWVRPIKSRIPYHVRAFESGMVSGNTEGACVGKWFTYWALYHSSSPLAVLEEDLAEMVPKARRMGFHMFADFFSVVLQLVLNLTGDSDNTTMLVGKAFNEADDKYRKMPYSLVCPTFKSYALVIFGDFEQGADDALERGNCYTQKMTGMQYGMEPFYRGVSLYAMARKTGMQKFKKPAAEVRKQYKVWVKKGCINLVGCLILLDAEHKALKGNKKAASKKFEGAIVTLAEGGLYSIAGIACERYAAYLVEIQDVNGARVQLLQAVDFYHRWGAKRKVQLLKEQLETLT